MSQLETPTRVESAEWVYERLLCEFQHWDTCLSGIVVEDGVRLWCAAYSVDTEDDQVESYVIYDIDWDDECEEWLADYMVAYRHWCYEDGERMPPIYGSIAWYIEKWKQRCPVKEKTQNAEWVMEG